VFCEIIAHNNDDIMICKGKDIVGGPERLEVRKKDVFGGGRRKDDVFVEFDGRGVAEVGDVFAEIDGTEVFECDALCR